MNGNAAPVRVELRNSFHHLPPGSKALKKTNGQRWLELTLGVRRLHQGDDHRPVPGLPAADVEPELRDGGAGRRPGEQQPDLAVEPAAAARGDLSGQVCRSVTVDAGLESGRVRFAVFGGRQTRVVGFPAVLAGGVGGDAGVFVVVLSHGRLLSSARRRCYRHRFAPRKKIASSPPAPDFMPALTLGLAHTVTSR